MSSERRSGTRESTSASRTRSTASFPAIARTCRTASASRLRLLSAAWESSSDWSPAGGPVSSARSVSERTGPGIPSSFD